MSSDESVFGPTSHADWAQVVTTLLGGAPPDSLDRLDEDGLVVSAFYPVDAAADADAPGTFNLPQAPADRVRHGWDICQPIHLANLTQTSVRAANTHILAALETGANGLWLSSDADITPALSSLFDGVLLPAISVTISSDAVAADMLESLQRLAGDDAISIGFTHSPLCPSAIAAGLELGGQPGVSSIFVADGWTLHNQGHTTVAELAAVLGGVAAVLRAGHEADHDLAALVSQISLSLALPADMFDGIAKLRAMRRLLTNLTAALDLDEATMPRLIGRPSLRMMSLLDPEENMLRTTTALLGGAIGGADSMVALGHDYLSGESEAARRLARMTQVMMIAESGLALSLDPAGGSAFIENRTDDLASAAWSRFQTIEAQGGLPAFAESGALAALAETANLEREAALRAGKAPLVGVTLQPAPEGPVAIADMPENPVRPAALVEAIRREAAVNPPRILVLQAETPDNAQLMREKAVTQLLAIAGLHPVVLNAGNDQDAALAAAMPNFVIVCPNADEAGADATANVKPPSGCQVVDAVELLADADQLGRLRAMITGAEA